MRHLIVLNHLLIDSVERLADKLMEARKETQVYQVETHGIPGDIVAMLPDVQMQINGTRENQTPKNQNIFFTEKLTTISGIITPAGKAKWSQ